MLIAAIHFVLFGYFLFRTAITSPISDMFTYIADYLQLRSGQIGLANYLWRPHGEHRLVWVRLLTWVDVELLHTRGVAFMAAASASICAAALLVWHQVRRAEPNVGGVSPLSLFAPMLFLTTANVVDCSVPINTTYPITVFFVVSSVVLFVSPRGPDRHLKLRRAAAILAASCAGLGTAAGLLAWPILVWIAWHERAGGFWPAVLVTLGGAYTMFYLHNLPVYGLAPVLEMHPASLLGAAHLSKMLDYFVAFLGLPFTREPALGLFGRGIGCVLLVAGASAVLFATFSARLNSPLDRIAIGMILLALGSAALAALGRSELVKEVPVRYAMFTTALHVGLLCLLLPRCVRRFASARGRMLLNTTALAFASLLLFQQVFVGRIAEQTAAAIARDADCFAQGTHAGPVSSVVSRAPAAAAQVVTALRQQGLLGPRSSQCTTP